MHAVSASHDPPWLPVHRRRSQAHHFKRQLQIPRVFRGQRFVKRSVKEELFIIEPTVGLDALAHHCFAQGHFLCRISKRTDAGHDLVFRQVHRTFKGLSVHGSRDPGCPNAQRPGKENDFLKAVAESFLGVCFAAHFARDIGIRALNNRYGQLVAFPVQQLPLDRELIRVFHLARKF